MFIALNWLKKFLEKKNGSALVKIWGSVPRYQGEWHILHKPTVEVWLKHHCQCQKTKYHSHHSHSQWQDYSWIQGVYKHTWLG